MLKYFFAICISLWISSIFAYNVNNYTINPKKMQNALELCPQQHPKGISCEELTKAFDHLNELSIELRMDPLAYGQSIIHLQETISYLLAKNNKEKYSDALHNNQQALAERLTIIKWLESPDIP